MADKIMSLLPVNLAGAGSSAAAQPEDFTFYSQLVKGWFESETYFEWASITANS
jgi:hypothetical protein